MQTRRVGNEESYWHGKGKLGLLLTFMSIYNPCKEEHLLKMTSLLAASSKMPEEMPHGIANGNRITLNENSVLLKSQGIGICMGCRCRKGCFTIFK